MAERTLTPKQERFCQLYTTYWEGTRAAKEAGFSEKTAGQQAFQLLQLPSVKARIAELTDHALREIGVSRERVLLEAARIAYFDPLKAHDEFGNPLAIKDMDEDTRRCISEVVIFEKFDGAGDQKHVIGLVKSVKFTPKKVGLDVLRTATDLATQKLEHSGPGGGPIPVRDLTGMTQEEIDAEIAAHEARRKAEGAKPND